ncbi:MAG TPA: YkgJ family cysteine cluster protein [Aliidongia sp.]|nr:YkgJ family cysteine cluster protein [Aliidongia sp.]
MDGRSMAFLQKKSQEVVTSCFESGITRDNLLRCALTELEFFEAISQSLIEAAPPERAFACAQGCDACCHQRIACTVPEAIGIALGLSARSDEEIAGVAGRAREVHEKSATLDPLARIRTGLPCPLLQDGACSIYEMRPLACRTVNSYDRKACDRFFRAFAFDKPRPQWGTITEATGQMLLGFGRALDSVGLDGGLVELSSALAMILADPGLIDRYLAGERVFEAARPARH